MEQKAFYGWLSFLGVFFLFVFLQEIHFAFFFVNAVDQRSATKPTYCFFQSLVKLLSDGLRHEVFQPFDLVFSLQVQTPSIFFFWGRGGHLCLVIWFTVFVLVFYMLVHNCQCVSQCLRDPSSPVTTSSSKKAVQSHKRWSQCEEGNHGRQSRGPHEQGKRRPTETTDQFRWCSNSHSENQLWPKWITWPSKSLNSWSGIRGP